MAVLFYLTYILCFCSSVSLAMVLLWIYSQRIDGISMPEPSYLYIWAVISYDRADLLLLLFLLFNFLIFRVSVPNSTSPYIFTDNFVDVAWHTHIIGRTRSGMLKYEQ